MKIIRQEKFPGCFLQREVSIKIIVVIHDTPQKYCENKTKRFGKKDYYLFNKNGVIVTFRNV